MSSCEGHFSSSSTEQFSVNELAARISRVGNEKGLNVGLQTIENPRKELEDHYYNATHTGLTDLGLEPHLMTDDVISSMLDQVLKFRKNIDTKKILPRVRWNS